MKLTLNLVTGEKLVHNIQKNICLIGRSPQSDIVIANESISRKHCQIEIKNGEIYVTDLGSSNGVLINNEKIEPNVPVLYQSFFGLSFGIVQSVLIEIEVIEAASSSSGSLKVAGNQSTPASNAMRKPRTESTRSSITQKDESKSKGKSPSNMIKIVFLLIALAAAAIYIMKEESPSAPTPAEIYE